ncbi:MAG: hypothetical protein WKG07_01345 [Hymenobacter sp.]
MSLGTFRFVQIKFEPSAAGDSAGRGRLDSRGADDPAQEEKPAGAKLQLVTKTNGFTGPGLTVTFRNRLALRGAEQLLIDGVASYETQTKRARQVTKTAVIRA